MSEFEYIMATDFDRAWLNFELDLPLKPGPNGEPNRFYVNRPGNPIAELIDALMAPFYRPPKFFFSGHRGCGKSTELLHLMANPGIQKNTGRLISASGKKPTSLTWIFVTSFWPLAVACSAIIVKPVAGCPSSCSRNLMAGAAKVEEEVKRSIPGVSLLKSGLALMPSSRIPA